MLVHLRRDEMALQRSQERLALRQAAAQRRRGLTSRRALAGTDLVHLTRVVGPSQLQRNPPPHRVPGPDPPARDIALPASGRSLLDNGPEDLDRAIHNAAKLDAERRCNPLGGPRSAA